MTNLSDITSEIIDLLVDYDREDTAQLDNWVRDAQRELEDAHSFLVMETGALFTTQVGVPKLADRPALWLKKAEYPYYIDGVGSEREMDWLPDESSRHYLYDRYSPLNVGAPGHLWIDEKTDEVIVYPTPDGNCPGTDNVNEQAFPNDGEYRVWMPYIARQELLTQPTSENWFTNNAREYLTRYGVWRGSWRNRDREEQVSYKAEMRDERQRLIREDRKARWMRNQKLRSRTGVRAPYNQGRRRPS